MLLGFRPVEISDVCLPFEAVEWVAFGRLPEVFPGEYGDEVRSNLQCLINADYDLSWSDFSKGELDALGVEVDYDAYLDAVYNTKAKDVDEYFNGSDETYDSGFYGPPRPEGYYAIKLMEYVEKETRPHLERAQLAVLLALMEGRLKARGYIVPSGWVEVDGAWVHEESGEERLRGFLEQAKEGPIPATAWENTPSIFDVGDGRTNLPGFIGAWIDFQEVLSTFPEPNLSPREVQGRWFGETLLVNGGAQGRVRTAPGRRGRPKKGDGIVERAVVHEFKRRAASRELPDKKEAIVQEIMDWTQSALGETISRTVAQRYLKQASPTQVVRPK